jgi:hypothetical protein
MPPPPLVVPGSDERIVPAEVVVAPPTFDCVVTVKPVGAPGGRIGEENGLAVGLVDTWQNAEVIDNAKLNFRKAALPN